MFQIEGEIVPAKVCARGLYVLLSVDESTRRKEYLCVREVAQKAVIESFPKKRGGGDIAVMLCLCHPLLYPDG